MARNREDDGKWTKRKLEKRLHGWKPKEKDKEKPLWQICFEMEWENAVNRIRKAMGKEPI